MSCANKSPALGMSLTNVTVATGSQRLGLGINVGSPHQTLALWPSTSDDNSFVYNANAHCSSSTDLQCIVKYSGVYNSSASSTYKADTLQTWNGSLGQVTSSGAVLDDFVFFQDNVGFGSSGSLPEFPLIMEATGQDGTSGLGLGTNSTFLSSVVASGQAPSRNYGLWTGSRSVSQPVAGALWVGGYDTYRTAGDLVSFTSTSDNCLTCTHVTALEYIPPSGSAVSLFSNSSEVISVGFQPLNAFLEVPNDIYTNFINVMTNQGAFNAYINGYATFKTNANLGNISVTLQNALTGGSYNTVIPASEMFTPPRGTNTNGQYVITNNTYLYDNFYNVSNTGYVLNWGWPFLAMNYLIVDFDAGQFRLAPARTGPATQSNGNLIQPLCSGIAATSTTAGAGGVSSGTGTATPGATTSPAAKSSSHVGAIAGGVVGGVAGLIIIGALIWFILRGKKREKALKDERDAAVAGGSEMGQRQEVMSQYTATSPTEVSEVYGGGKAHESTSINQWLSAQNRPQGHSELEPVNPQTIPPNSPTFTNTHPSHLSTASANMNEPFEMPAYQYR